MSKSSVSGSEHEADATPFHPNNKVNESNKGINISYYYYGNRIVSFKVKVYRMKE